VRVTAAFSRLLDLSGVWVRKVRFEPDQVVVWVALRRKKLVCPKCSYSTMARENEQDHDSVWRHLDLGVWRLEIRARLRRLRCPEHGVHVEGVPFARDGARFTRDFEDLVVRHEALLNRVGCRSPPPGCRSSSVKRGAA
jgi:transposase